MNVDQAHEIIMQHAPQVVSIILMVLGALVVIGSTYVKLTPTDADDKWWASLEQKPFVGALFKLLVRFSPFYRKEVPVKEPSEKVG